MKHLLGLKPSAPAITQYIDSLAEAAGAAKTPDIKSYSDVVYIKSYSDVVYINYYPLGISLLFAPRNNYKPRTGLKLSELQQDNLTLDSIDIYNVPKPKVEEGEKPKVSRSELVFTTFPILPIVLPITAQVKDKDGKAIERLPQLDITLETSGKDFVKALGEPDRKGGGTGPSSGSINIWCEWLNDGVMVEFGGAQARGPQAWEMGKDAIWRVITFFQPGPKRE